MFDEQLHALLARLESTSGSSETPCGGPTINPFPADREERRVTTVTQVER